MRLGALKSRGAIVLSELLVAVLLMSLIFSLATVLMVRVIRLNSAREAYVKRLEAADFLLRGLTRDVNRARGFMEQSGSYNSGDKTLILDQGERRVIYAADAGVVRIEQAGEKMTRIDILRDANLQVRFTLEGRSPEEAKSVVTNVSWTEPPVIGISQPALSHRSALRN